MSDVPRQEPRPGPPVDATDPTLGRPPDAPGLPPLLVPDVPFPPYRFVPGRAPHPFAHTGGWGFGASRPVPPFVARDGWRDSRNYLAGVDLFNRGWWWEAHEVWEELWHVVEGKDAAQHDLLKGLIQLAACALNRERGSDAAAERLLASAQEFLRRAEEGAGAPRVMGLDLPALRAAAHEVLGAPCPRVDAFHLLPE